MCYYLVVIQFVVITIKCGRISEVAARFVFGRDAGQTDVR
jgi:flagellar biosynthesis component FlhA